LTPQNSLIGRAAYEFGVKVSIVTTNAWVSGESTLCLQCWP
jgi:hypothetical protein